MRRTLILATFAAFLVLIASTALASQAQSATPQEVPKVTAEQQKQLDQLRQLDIQLQKDRDALYTAVDKYGWDSDQVDGAQEQLVRDRTQYRRLRRSLDAVGLAVPPPSDSRATMNERGRYGYRRGGHHGCCWDDDGYCCYGHHGDDHCCGGRGR